MSSSNKKKIRPTIIEKVNDFEKINSIREKIRSFWFDSEVPTLSKVLAAINENETLPNMKRSSFQKISKKRTINLNTIKQYRAQGRQIYYLDKTWVNAGEIHGRTWVHSSVYDMTHLRKASQQDKKNPRAKVSSSSSYILDHLTAFSRGAFVLRIENKIIRLP